MKRQIFSILVCTLFVLTSFSVMTTAISDETQQEATVFHTNSKLSTHSVLGEYSTATWCGYCKYAHGALKNLFGGNWWDMWYVSLVDDKNTHADQRNTELGVSGFPTVTWDGGYDADVGASSIPGAMSTYNSSLSTVTVRTVADIDIDLTVTWNGNANMDIDVQIDNNEASSYNGYIRVFVTEIESSLGWSDTGGHPYTFAFLDYAFDQSLSISSSGSWSDSINWDGNDYDNGFGVDFGSITYGNIAVIAAVYDSSSEVDETAGVLVGDFSGTPPTPNTPLPADSENDVSVTPTLTWEPEGIWVYPYTYDIYFGTSTNPPLVATDHLTNSYSPTGLTIDTTYYWKIVVRNQAGLTSTGPIWSFTTRGNTAPNSPYGPDPENGATDIAPPEELSWSCTDPENDALTFDVYLGTSSNPPLIQSGVATTSYEPTNIHYETTYYWKIVAEDEFGYTTEGNTWTFTTATNQPPNTPENPNPADGETDVYLNKILSWTCIDPEDDTLRYDVYFGTDSNPPLVSEDQPSAAYSPGNLDYETTYYWKINAHDTYDNIVQGPVWSFTTLSEYTPIPELTAQGSLTWTKVSPESTVTGSFTILNTGETDSELDWEISEYPDWGNWSFNPESGDGLTPADGTQTISVTVVAPADKKTDFSGTVTIINSDDPSETATIQVALSTPYTNPIALLLEKLAMWFPNLSILIELLF